MKLFKPLIIPLILVFGYLMLVSYPYFFSKITRFSSLGILSLVEERSVDIQRTFSPKRVTDQFDNHLLKGEKAIAKFKATEDNFGILLFRFSQLSAIVKDSVTFRIKEEGQDNWYYEYTYRADQFQGDQYFTFGFPPIPQSKDKVYIFEIESLAGTYQNGIGVSNKKPQVAAVYKFTREDLASVNIFAFILKKIIYVLNNLNIWQNWQILVASLFIYLLYFIRKKKITLQLLRDLLGWSSERLANKKLANKIKSKYLLQVRRIVSFLKKLTRNFYASQFYSVLLNTNMKKRVAIGLLVFLIALLYRFSRASVDQLGVSSFYASLGGQGDYDQFIRAATCALKLCPAILGQNFLIESSILGLFYEVWGFVGGLKAYLYLMIIFSSIVAVLPYILLSRKNFFTIGGIIGSLFLATSDYLTYVAIALPPDNLSVFVFSMFFIVYLLTLHIGTIRWLLFFGLMGTIDGLNKLILLPNDLAALIFFVPVFLYEKAKRIKKFPFVKLNLKLIFYSILPFLVFLVIYSAWEYFVQIKFARPYYLRALIEGGSVFASSTYEGSRSINESFSKGILEILYYYAGLSIVMLKRLNQNAGLNTMFLTPIFIGMLFVTLRKTKFFITKLISEVIFASLVIVLLVLFRVNYLHIQDIGQYVYAWTNDLYVDVFLFASIIFLFILNFRYQVFKLALPIIPYTIMLIILSKNAPWVRLLAHVIVWSIILFSFLIDWILDRVKIHILLKRLWIGPIILMLFVSFFTIPKLTIMVGKLWEGISIARNEVQYLKWVNTELPKNAIVLAGGESDLVTVGENINRPIIYNSLWGAALLIKPKEIPGVKPTNFAILDQLKISEMKGITPSNFSIILELENKENFAKNKYLILEDDIYLWRSRMVGVHDSVFGTASSPLLHADGYSIKVYKFNPALNKGIYELNLRETGSF